jgi:hypothetical protein
MHFPIRSWRPALALSAVVVLVGCPCREWRYEARVLSFVAASPTCARAAWESEPRQIAVGRDSVPAMRAPFTLEAGGPRFTQAVVPDSTFLVTAELRSCQGPASAEADSIRRDLTAWMTHVVSGCQLRPVPNAAGGIVVERVR